MGVKVVGEAMSDLEITRIIAVVIDYFKLEAKSRGLDRLYVVLGGVSKVLSELKSETSAPQARVGRR